MNETSSVEAMLAESVEDFFSARCDLRTVRSIESGAPADALWGQAVEAGYADALVPDSLGGSGLALSEAWPIVWGCGRHVAPVPLAQTMLVRGAMAERGFEIPQGSIAIAEHGQSLGGGWLQCPAVPFGRTADWVLVSLPDADWLLPTSAAERAACDWRPSASDLRWARIPADAIRWARMGPSGALPVDWPTQAAALTAAQMAGALQRMAEMTITYANERVQFGKPIGKLQAIQQQLSVMTEQVAAGGCAAQMGLRAIEGSAWRVDPLRAAVSKARACEAVVSAAPIAHAVHGAIGISEEYDLQMLTRQLHDWRLQYGSESHWHARVGLALLRDDRTAAQFVRLRLGAAPMTA